MDIAALQSFLAVAETGSFSRAAERVFLTQPAVSKRIAGLESRLGTRLFDRIGKRVQLTPAGLALQARARTLLRELDDVKRSIADLSGEIAGELRLATSHHIGLHRLPQPLQHFHATYPGVHLDLRFMDSEQACNDVARGEIELAIVTLPPVIEPPLVAEVIWNDPLDIVVARHHALAKVASVKPRDLADVPAILPGPGTYTREIILKALGPWREKIGVGMSTNYLEVLKMLAAIGLGWTALPRTMIDDSLTVLTLDKVRIERRLGFVVHGGRTLSNAAQAMITLLRQPS
jgi:DNA-binding transcriptional LysR family regulator